MRAKGSLVRFLLFMAASLAAVMLVVACAVEQRHGAVPGAGQERGSWATEADLAWLKRLGAWDTRLMRGLRGDAGTSRVEPRFGRIAGALAGKQLEVRCWSTADWHRLVREEQTYTRGQLGSETLGFAGIGGDRVNLAPDVCGSLVDLAYNRARPSDEAGQRLLAAAVVTLSHEPQHSKGIADEAVAECNSIQVAHRTAMKLGASRTYAASLVRTYWRHYDDELDAYRSSECHKSGALDLGYADSIWP